MGLKEADSLNQIPVKFPKLFITLGVLFAVVGMVHAAWAAGDSPSPKFGLPLACNLGSTCWLVNLPDHDPGPGVKDYTCGSRTYNGHTGVDFAIRDYSKMDDGVPVVAAADGTVLRFRDGMLDGDVSLVGQAAVAAQGCGNSVVIEHGGGWQSYYCHLRRNSLVVRRGQRVQKGDKLGLVGSSGLAQFPHVHLGIQHNGKVIDPFVGRNRAANCGLGEATLWDARTVSQVNADTTALYDAGFAQVEINPVALRRGFYRRASLPDNAKNIVFWVDAFWVQDGDQLALKVTAPNGRVLVEKSSRLTKTQARYMMFAGKRKTVDWRHGLYQGEAVLTRSGNDGKITTYKINRTLEIL